MTSVLMMLYYDAQLVGKKEGEDVPGCGIKSSP
jgi:hypothetical protein